MKNYFDFTGKVAVVTGASSGLGADAAKAYAECGASVALLARRKEKLADVAEEIKALGGKVITVACDVTDEQMVKAAVDEVISSLGRIDILLNNAGVAVAGAVHQLSEADWDKVLDTNLKGMYLMCKHVVPHMMWQNYGKIVNLSSVNAIIGDKVPVLARHSYNASKAGVRGLTLGMAASYGMYGITVNCVSPGVIRTEMNANLGPEDLAALAEETPLGTIGEPEDVAEALWYLASPAAKFVTGQVLAPNGGLII